MQSHGPVVVTFAAQLRQPRESGFGSRRPVNVNKPAEDSQTVQPTAYSRPRMELECAVQKYAWGVYGLKSFVAQLAKAVSPDLEVSEEEPFAELWMGTHPNGPSVIKGSGETLGHYIRRHPGVLGTPVIQTFGEQLPFLFKVLSVNQALSIQAHPNKSHAEELHQERPDVYKDPNHKPEMTIALTPFQALCGFRPSQEITKHLTELPELQQVVGEENAKTFIEEPTEANLKSCFSTMMNAPKENIESALSDLLTRLAEMDSAKGDELLRDLFTTLHEKYPGDVGCFSIYLLNYLTLQPGQAMFLGPNIIHAYLFGGNCSANMYDPPPQVPSGVGQYTLRPVESASIVLVVEGKARKVEANPSAPGELPQVTSLQRGSVIFLAADQSLTVRPTSGSRLLAFRALIVEACTVYLSGSTAPVVVHRHRDPEELSLRQTHTQLILPTVLARVWRASQGKGIDIHHDALPSVQQDRAIEAFHPRRSTPMAKKVRRRFPEARSSSTTTRPQKKVLSPRWASVLLGGLSRSQLEKGHVKERKKASDNHPYKRKKGKILFQDRQVRDKQPERVRKPLSCSGTLEAEDSGDEEAGVECYLVVLVVWAVERPVRVARSRVLGARELLSARREAAAESPILPPGMHSYQLPRHHVNYYTY
ncbi:Mannose-6-phosphate isomerase [Portunus trituberculatus]|uniref:mannose-6-phosphate isomerase n=1 Tax=Portunus trituberculatus TaxID=210409 RepID=A0A5B7EQ19_PORTR|nr:Mannose-6-phosphate isomerase [Portunus trituberculatus]